MGNQDSLSDYREFINLIRFNPNYQIPSYGINGNGSTVITAENTAAARARNANRGVLPGGNRPNHNLQNYPIIKSVNPTSKPKDYREEQCARTCTFMFTYLINLWKIAIINPTLNFNKRNSYIELLEKYQNQINERMKRDLKMTSTRLMGLFDGFQMTIKTGKFYNQVMFPSKNGRLKNGPSLSGFSNSRIS